MDTERKIAAKLATLEGEIDKLAALIDRAVALIATPLTPPSTADCAAVLGDIDALEAPFRRATRALEFELRRSGDFIASPSAVHSGPLVNRVQYIARRSLRAWQALRDCLARALAAREDEIHPTWLKDMAETQVDALARAFVLVDQILNSTDQDDAAAAFGAYRDIPMLPHLYMALMHGAMRAKAAVAHEKPLRYLDVGSGRGTTLLMASRYFPVVHGIEFDPGFHDRANRLLGTEYTLNCRSILANALEFENYDEYDIIYFYKPMSDIDLLAEMEVRIVEQARPGTLLIAPYLGFFDRHEAEVTKVDWHIYLRNGAGYTGKDIRKAIAHIGPFVRHPDTAISSKVCGHWAPLVRALSARGFRPATLE
ncbi:MAG: class I SAM-dependent methyltransferase [Paracoccaceae bacterium]